MSINILLAALDEYFVSKKDFMSGCNTEGDLTGAKKRFAQALNQYIDFLADGVLEERRRRISTGSSVKIADMLTSNMDDTVSATTALVSAPSPPEHMDDNWMNAYRSWYNTSRKQGMMKP